MEVRGDQLIPWRVACRQYFGISPATAWRWEQRDPEFAALKLKNGPQRYAALLSSIQRYIANRPPAGPPKTPENALAAARERREEIKRAKAEAPA